MSAVEKIEAVLKTDLLLPQLLIIPTRGASDQEILEEEALLGRTLCSDHIAILRRWNGIELEVVRLFGCGDNNLGIGRLSALQLGEVAGLEGKVAVGSDASGFVYLQADDRKVFALDTEGLELEMVAGTLDEFFERLVFWP